MRVGIVPSDVPSCEFFRSRGPAQALAAQGEIEIRLLTDELTVRYANRQHGFGVEPVGLTNPPDVDVVVLVRGVFAQRIHDVIKFLQRNGIAVVVDYDDLYAHLPPELHARYKINPNTSPHYNWRHAQAAAKLADLVTVSTPALQRRAPGSVLLRNCIPQRYIDAGRQVHRDGTLVGWGGTVYGHPGDLRVCGGGVAEAIERTGSRFLNVGDGVKVKTELGLRADPEVTGIVDFKVYPHHLARIDVAIAPLKQTLYSEAKSALKMLESLACGSQVVASDAPEYKRVAEDLRQFTDEPPVATARSRGRDWRRELVRALERAQDEDKRRQMASIARRYVSERWRLEDWAHYWAEAWERAVKIRRGKVAA